MKKILLSILILSIGLFVFSCKDKKSGQTTEEVNYSKIEIPVFSADSAYSYVKAQCDFGPRTPGSKAHELCASYLVEFMKKHADTVIVQEFTSKLYDGTEVKGKNIVVSFNTESNNRVVFGAHWDSRLWADQDKNPENHKSPVMGANDGASGVAVLMEMTRAMKQKKLSYGIDIVFFDLEDQGTPEWAESTVEDQSDWCLGSQYWSKNPHTPYYTANYGILLDMVGYSNARFTKEAISMNFASSIMDKVWKIASDKGYSSMFVNERTGAIMDDHYWVNINAKIPMIDIVQNDPTTSFFPYWHTVNDNIEHINKNSLKAVGDICLTAIYSSN